MTVFIHAVVMLKKFRIVLFLSPLLLILNHCANPVSPSGGPKDTAPPVNLRCFPPDHSVYFHSKIIRMDFNEFFQLKDPGNQIMISPPWLSGNDYKIRGKSLTIHLEDTLRPNTTYALNFGNSIADIAEGNILQNFTYVFGTGSYIDSLSIEGTVRDAFSLAPLKDVLVMLYLNNNDTVPFDSLPYKVKPFYVTRTNPEGYYKLTNLADTSYKLFALKDLNNNYLFDLPDEKIAFCDTLVQASYIVSALPVDSVKPDSMKADSLRKDSLILKTPIKRFNDLRLFQQFDSVQYVIRAETVQEKQVGIYFRYPLRDYCFNPLNAYPSTGWAIEELSRNRDTLYLWVRDYPSDSLILQMFDNEKIVDTVELDLSGHKGKTRAGKKDQAVVKRLAIKTNFQGRFLNQFKGDLRITFSYPLSSYNLSSILLFEGKDTLKPSVSLTDSIQKTISVHCGWKEDKKYTVIIPDSSFYSITSITNDSTALSFSTRSIRDFGSLKMNITTQDTTANYIIQLLNEKDQVLEERFVTGSGKLNYEYLTPQKYKFRAINDRNKNNRWDTGTYLKNLQPEEVINFPKTLEIRANWEVEEDWSL
jgi:hypothetical protein